MIIPTMTVRNEEGVVVVINVTDFPEMEAKGFRRYEPVPEGSAVQADAAKPKDDPVTRSRVQRGKAGS